MWTRNKWNRKARERLAERRRAPQANVVAEAAGASAPAEPTCVDVAAMADELLRKWDDAIARVELHGQLQKCVEAGMEATPCRARLALMVNQAVDLVDSSADEEVMDSQTQQVMSALQRWAALVETRRHEINPLVLAQELVGCLEGSAPTLSPVPCGLHADLNAAEVAAEVLPEHLGRKVVNAAKLLSSHLEPQLLRRELTKAVEADDFDSVINLSGELKKLCPRKEDVAELLHAADEASTDESVVFPSDRRRAEPPATQRANTQEHRKHLAELGRHSAREQVLQHEVSYLQQRLRGHQDNPEVGRAALITDTTKDQETYLGWLCTIVGQREDAPRTWVLKLMWKHPLGDLVQMPIESFIVHPALDKMRARLRELPGRQPQCRADIEALQSRILRAATPRAPGASETLEMEAPVSQSSVAESRQLRRCSSDSPILARTVPEPRRAAAAENQQQAVWGPEVGPLARLEMNLSGLRPPSSGSEGATSDIFYSEEPTSKRRREEPDQMPSASASSSRSAPVPSSEAPSQAGARAVPRGEREHAGWTQEEEKKLIEGQKRYGNHWETIRKKCKLMHRKGTQCREKWRNLQQAPE